MKYRSVIFDFDGTLANTEALALNIYNELADRYDYEPVRPEELQALKKMTFREMMDSTRIPMAKLPKILKTAQRLMRGEMSTVSPFDPALKEHLVELKSRMEYLGIITSNTRKNVTAFLDHQGIDLFDFIVSSPLMSKQVKLQAVSRKYGLEKDDILYVGDESRDIVACKAAGVDCAAVAWGYNHPDTLLKEEPEYLVEDWTGLLEIVGK